MMPSLPRVIRPFALLYFVLPIANIASAQTPAQRHSQIQARMRPIGSMSAVDRIRAQNGQRRGTQGVAADNAQSPSTNGKLRQVVKMQQSQLTAPPLNNNGAMNVPQGPNAGPNAGAVIVDNAPPQPTSPRTLPNNPNRTLPTQPLTNSPSDLVPMNQPQLSNHGFATIDNCNCVSAPIGYSAASGYGCGSPYGYVSQVGCNCNVATPAYLQAVPQQGYAAQPYSPPPVQLPAPAVMPQFQTNLGGYQGGFGFPNGLPRALISLGQNLNAVQVGEGIIGQPVAYVPGQILRNWLRYIFP